MSVAADALRGAGYEEARKVALKFNDTNLRGKTLAEVADAWIRSKIRERAIEILSEAYETAAKGEPSADRAAITLLLAQKSRSSIQNAASASLKPRSRPSTGSDRGPGGSAVTNARPRIRSQWSITVVGGAELTTESRHP